jgi:hypothetical protein
MVERNLAALLMRDLLAMSAPLNSATLLTNQIADKEERERFRRGIGTVMNEIYVNLMMPIIRQYPELNPDTNKVTKRPATIPAFVGPHEGKELELMCAGVKPLSMFPEPLDSEFELFPEDEFDQLVSEGRLKKCVKTKVKRSPDGAEVPCRYVLYALPGEEWRMKAVILVQELYDSLAPGWRPDLDRLIGLLLGYRREDIEDFLRLRGFG